MFLVFKEMRVKILWFQLPACKDFIISLLPYENKLNFPMTLLLFFFSYLMFLGIPGNVGTAIIHFRDVEMLIMILNKLDLTDWSVWSVKLTKVLEQRLDKAGAVAIETAVHVDVWAIDCAGKEIIG